MKVDGMLICWITVMQMTPKTVIVAGRGDATLSNDSHVPDFFARSDVFTANEIHVHEITGYTSFPRNRYFVSYQATCEKSVFDEMIAIVH
jgi:hypothetical protein